MSPIPAKFSVVAGSFSSLAFAMKQTCSHARIRLRLTCKFCKLWQNGPCIQLCHGQSLTVRSLAVNAVIRYVEACERALKLTCARRRNNAVC